MEEIRIINGRKYILPYKNGVLNGKVLSFSKKGILTHETPYVNGKINGYQTWWYDNGEIQRKSFYVDGLNFGISQWWYKGIEDHIITYSVPGDLINGIYVRINYLLEKPFLY